jgi:hypothetical protein
MPVIVNPLPTIKVFLISTLSLNVEIPVIVTPWPTVKVSLISTLSLNVEMPVTVTPWPTVKVSLISTFASMSTRPSKVVIPVFVSSSLDLKKAVESKLSKCRHFLLKYH